MLITTAAHDVRRLTDLLNAAEPDALVDFAMMSAAVGYEIRTQRYKLLQAKRLALRETGAAFVSVRGKGYQRIIVERLAGDIGGSARRQMRRKARVANQALHDATRQLNGIPDEVRRDVLREQSSLGLIEFISRNKQLPKIDDNETRPLTYAQTAQLVLATLQPSSSKTEE